MNKLRFFVRLDFVTVKSYFTVKNLMIYAAIAVFLTVINDNSGVGISVGLMLGTMFAGYPFAIGEKNNMDALYITLSVSRKNVVAGRYLFTLAINLCGILFALVLSVMGMLAERLLGYNVYTTDTLPALIVLPAMFIIVQAIQLPFFFKLGYTKARFFSIIPFVVLMAVYIVILGAMSTNGIVAEFLTTVAAIIGKNGVTLAAISIATICIIVGVSYNLSLSFYKKREF